MKTDRPVRKASRWLPLLTSSCGVSLAFVLSGCQNGGELASGDDGWTGYGSESFPYDAAGNYVGGGQDQAGEAATLPAASDLPVPNYGTETMVASAPEPEPDYSAYSTPTPPSTPSDQLTYVEATAPPVRPQPGYAPPEPEPDDEPVAAAPPAPGPESAPSTHRYTVRRGDTAWKIASAYGTSVSALREANGMSGNTVVVGQTINVPGTPPAAGASSTAASGASYTVRRGDTLYSIGRKFGVSHDTIRRANSLSGDTVVSGQTLTIPGASAASAATPRSHRVQRGDTLYSIARQYRVSQSAIRSANGLDSNNVVLGSTLRIP